MTSVQYRFLPFPRCLLLSSVERSRSLLVKRKGGKNEVFGYYKRFQNMLSCYSSDLRFLPELCGVVIFVSYRMIIGDSGILTTHEVICLLARKSSLHHLL